MSQTASSAMRVPSTMAATQSVIAVPGSFVSSIQAMPASLMSSSSASMMDDPDMMAASMSAAQSNELSAEAAASSMAESAMTSGDASAAPSMSITMSLGSWFSNKSMIWGFFMLVVAMAIVAFVLSLVLYFKVNDAQKNACCKATKLQKQVCALRERVAENEVNSHTLIGEWSITSASLTVSTGPQPMLFSAATPYDEPIVNDAQSSTSSVLPVPFSGTLTAISIEANAVPSAGSTFFTVSVNGVATTMTAEISSTSTTPFVTVSDSIEFAAGDKIGINVTNMGMTLVAPETFTAQLFANFVI
jgi:uncharacterized membrane protein